MLDLDFFGPSPASPATPSTGDGGWVCYRGFVWGTEVHPANMDGLILWLV